MPPEPPHHRAERAFTLIEILIAMVIMAILATLAVLSLTGAKSATSAKETVATGSTYSQAIAQFQADHANRNPTTVTDAKQGPMNLIGKPYIGGVPDAVSAGRVGVSWNVAGACGTTVSSAPPGATTQAGWVSACFGGAHGAEPGYGVRVVTKLNKGDAWSAANTVVCWIGSTPQGPRCDDVSATD